MAAISAFDIIDYIEGRYNVTRHKNLFKPLLERGWIMALPGSQDSRKKEYFITDEGEQAAACELKRLQELVRNGQIYLEGAENEKDYTNSLV